MTVAPNDHRRKNAVSEGGAEIFGGAGWDSARMIFKMI
jgi:hypothetical protein